MLTFVSVVAVSAQPVFKYAELKETTSLTIPADSEKENSVGGSAGIRLVFGEKALNLDARTFITLPKTKCSVLSKMDSPADVVDTLGNLRYGAGLRFGKTISVNVKGGMLSFSRAITRLKNPTPSSGASPLTKSFGFSSGIGANLPTLSSAEKPLAVFVSIAADKKQFRIPWEAQFACDEDKTAFTSFLCTAQFSRLVTLQSVVTAGRFFVENKTKYFSDTNADFEAQWLYAASLETAFRSPLAKANLFAGFHQTPFAADFSPCAVWIKASARTSWRCFLLDASYFFIPTLANSPKSAPLVGGSSTVCRTIRQFGLNPQMQFLLGNTAVLRLGLHGLFEKKILNTREAEQFSTVKWNAGIAYETKPFTAKLTAGETNLVLDGSFLTESTTPDSYYSFDATSSLSLTQIKASVSFGYDRYPKSAKTGDTKDSFSASVSANPGKARILSLTSGFSVSYKNGEKTTSTASASATVSLKAKYVRTSIKCAVSVPM